MLTFILPIDMILDASDVSMVVITGLTGFCLGLVISSYLDHCQFQWP